MKVRSLGSSEAKNRPHARGGNATAHRDPLRSHSPITVVDGRFKHMAAIYDAGEVKRQLAA
jgi:hypothetical protein